MQTLTKGVMRKMGTLINMAKGPYLTLFEHILQIPTCQKSSTQLLRASEVA